MPNFDFLCTCGNVYERFFEFGKADRKVPCICGKLAERQINFPMIYLRGQGFSVSGDFYEPDYNAPLKNASLEERVEYQKAKDAKQIGRSKRIHANINPPCNPSQKRRNVESVAPRTSKLATSSKNRSGSLKKKNSSVSVPVDIDGKKKS